MEPSSPSENSSHLISLIGNFKIYMDGFGVDQALGSKVAECGNLSH